MFGELGRFLFFNTSAIGMIFIILCIFALVKAEKKRIIVFYDISDAFLFFLIILIIEALTALSFSLSMGKIGSELFILKFKGIFSRDLWNGIFMVRMSLWVFLLIYSFYVAYIYNRAKKVNVFWACLGRFTAIFFLIELSLSVPIVSFFIIKLRIGLIDLAFIFFKQLVSVTICIMVMRFLIYNRVLSKMSFYVNFKHMRKLGDEFYGSQGESGKR